MLIDVRLLFQCRMGLYQLAVDARPAQTTATDASTSTICSTVYDICEAEEWSLRDLASKLIDILLQLWSTVVCLLPTAGMLTAVT